MMDLYSKIKVYFQPKAGRIRALVSAALEKHWLRDLGLKGSKTEPIKIFLPTHEMYWKIPYERKLLLANEIDEILKGVQRTRATAQRRKVYLPSTSSYGIGMPSPGGWVLVDLKDSSFVHKSYMGELVSPGGEYVVLCMGSTEIPRGLLRPFHTRERGQGEDEDGDAVLVDADGGEDIERVA